MIIDFMCREKDISRFPPVKQSGPKWGGGGGGGGGWAERQRNRGEVNK